MQFQFFPFFARWAYLEEAECCNSVQKQKKFTGIIDPSREIPIEDRKNNAPFVITACSLSYCQGKFKHRCILGYRFEPELTPLHGPSTPPATAVQRGHKGRAPLQLRSLLLLQRTAAAGSRRHKARVCPDAALRMRGVSCPPAPACLTVIVSS